MAEYHRRYARPPPKGFDKWWDFAQKNHIRLIDEYDTVMRDIEPFLALPPGTFKARNSELANDPTDHYFTFNIRKGILDISGSKKEMERAEDMKQLLESFAGFLPDMQ